MFVVIVALENIMEPCVVMVVHVSLNEASENVLFIRVSVSEIINIKRKENSFIFIRKSRQREVYNWQSKTELVLLLQIAKMFSSSNECSG